AGIQRWRQHRRDMEHAGVERRRDRAGAGDQVVGTGAVEHDLRHLDELVGRTDQRGPWIAGAAAPVAAWQSARGVEVSDVGVRGYGGLVAAEAVAGALDDVV